MPPDVGLLRLLDDQYPSGLDHLNLLNRLRGGGGLSVALELKDLEEVNRRQNEKAKLSAREVFNSLMRPSSLKAVLILVALMVLMMASGATVVGFYAVDILQVGWMLFTLSVCRKPEKTYI